MTVSDDPFGSTQVGCPPSRGHEASWLQSNRLTAPTSPNAKGHIVTSAPPPPPPSPPGEPGPPPSPADGEPNGSMSTQTVILIIAGIVGVVALVLGIVVLGGDDDDPDPVATNTMSPTPTTTSTPTPAASPTPVDTPTPVATPTPIPTPTATPTATATTQPPNTTAAGDNPAKMFRGGAAYEPAQNVVSTDPAAYLAQWGVTGLPYAASGTTEVIDFQVSVSNSSSGVERLVDITTRFTTNQTVDQIAAVYKAELEAEGIDVTVSSSNNDDVVGAAVGGRNDDGQFWDVSVSQLTPAGTRSNGAPNGLTLVDVRRQSPRGVYEWDGKAHPVVADALATPIATAEQAGATVDGWEFRTNSNQFSATEPPSENYGYEFVFPGKPVAFANKVGKATDQTEREDDSDTVSFEADGARWLLIDPDAGSIRSSNS